MNRKIYRQPPAESVESLLQAAGLPTCDLNEAMLAHFFACGDPRDPTGVVGIELYGSDALLRSLVVRTGERRHGSGRALVAVAEAYARDAGVSTVYLLTETAAEFFTTLGYSPRARASAPATIRGTSQFSSVCPDSACLMARVLVPPAGETADRSAS